MLWNKNRVKSTACLQRLWCVSGLSAGSPENTERYWLLSAERVLIGTISKFSLSNIEDLYSSSNWVWSFTQPNMLRDLQDMLDTLL